MLLIKNMGSESFGVQETKDQEHSSAQKWYREIISELRKLEYEREKSRVTPGMIDNMIERVKKPKPKSPSKTIHGDQANG